METPRSKSGEIVEMVECRSVDICCVRETRFKGKLVRMISGKVVGYKLFWIKNEKGLGLGIFLAKKYVDISKVSDRKIVIKGLVHGIIISAIPVCNLQCGLNDSQKDDFYDSIVNVVRKLGSK